MKLNDKQLTKKELELLNTLIRCGYDGMCEDEEMKEYDNFLDKFKELK